MILMLAHPALSLPDDKLVLSSGFPEKRGGQEVMWPPAPASRTADVSHRARTAGFPPGRVYFHGNNKSGDELRQSLEWCVGRIVVDNLHELALLGRRARVRGESPVGRRGPARC